MSAVVGGDDQKRERLRTVLGTIIQELQVSLRGLWYTLETLQSLDDIKQHEASAKIVVEAKRLIEIYPHNKECLYHEPLFLPTPATRQLDKASLEKLRAFQSAVLFTLWKVKVRLSVVEAFVVATPSLPKLVSIATTLKEMKALFVNYTPPPSAKIDLYEAQVAAVRQAIEQRATRTMSTPLTTAAATATPSDDASPPAVVRANSVASPNVPRASASTTNATTTMTNATTTMTTNATTTMTTTTASTRNTAAQSMSLAQSAATVSTTASTTASTSTTGVGAQLTPIVVSKARAGDDRSILLAALDAACFDIDQRLDALRAGGETALHARAGEEAVRTHTLIADIRSLLTGRRFVFGDAPSSERVRAATAARRCARIGKIALLRTLNDYSLLELRLHIRRSRERLASGSGALTPTDAGAMTEFGCMLRDIAAVIADADEATSSTANSPLSASRALQRTRARRVEWRSSLIGRCVELAARLAREQRDASLVQSELRHFREVEAAVIDANARAQVLNVALRALKAKTRALTRQQYHAASAGVAHAADVDINVLELELLELTVQLDARTVALRDSMHSPSLALSPAQQAVTNFVAAFSDAAPHFVSELGALLRTPSERDDAARLITDSLYPDLLTSSAEIALLRALAPTLTREAADATSPDRVMPIDSASASQSFARCLMLRYGRRRVVRALAVLVLRDPLSALCADLGGVEENSILVARIHTCVRDIFERLSRAIDQTPVGLRWLARELTAAMRRHHPVSTRNPSVECAAARLIFGALFAQAALYPDLYGVFSIDQMPRSLDALALLSRVVAHIGAGVRVSGDLMPYAELVDGLHNDAVRLVARLGDVGDLGAYLDYPRRPPPGESGDIARRLSPCRVLRPSELIPLLRLVDAKPSGIASVDSLLARAARELNALSDDVRHGPVMIAVAIDGALDAMQQQQQSSAATSVQQRDDTENVRRALCALFEASRDVTLYTLADMTATTAGGLLGLLESISKRAGAPASAVQSLIDALRQCALKNDSLLHRLDASLRMRQLALRQLLIDKCEFVQALREQRAECASLAAEQRAYVAFVRQLSADAAASAVEAACGQLVGTMTRDFGASREVAGMSMIGATPSTTATLDYTDAETLFAFDCSLSLADAVFCWQ